MTLSARKEKPCAECGDPFYPSKSTQKVCSFKCAVDHGKEKVKTKKVKEFKAETRELKRELRKSDRNYQLRKLQDEFNAFIRARDHDQPCISCGRTEVEWTPGGQWDAGHFISRGAAPELRFEELNCYKQCKTCNGGSNHFSKKRHTVAKEYEERLRAKIGDEKVDWLKGPHAPKKYTLEDIAELRSLYKQKLKDLK